MQYITRNTAVTDWEMPDDLMRVGSELYWKDTYKAPELVFSNSKQQLF